MVILPSTHHSPSSSIIAYHILVLPIIAYNSSSSPIIKKKQLTLYVQAATS
ncbi:MAG: hypothetical protein ACFN4V_01495 [Prevotella denticola]